MLHELYHTFLQIRRLLREIGNLSNVPIEPIEQTQLIDQCLNIEGVLVGAVPGAGGYDAIYCICIGNDSRKNLLDFYKSMSVEALECTISDGSGLSLL